MTTKKTTKTESTTEQAQQAAFDMGANPLEYGAQFVKMMQDMAQGQTERFDKLRGEFEAMASNQMGQWGQFGEQMQAMHNASMGYVKEVTDIWRSTTLELVKQANEMFQNRAA